MNELVTISEYAENQDQMMNDIIETRGANLPATIEDVVQIFEFTDFKAKAFKIMADKCKKLDDQSEIYHSALRSGQKWGIATLYSQKIMGEITREMPKAGGKDTPINIPRKHHLLEENGVSSTFTYDAEKLANNPGILEEVIQKAEEKGEIPTKKDVLNTIRIKDAEDRDKRSEEKRVIKQVKETPRAVKEYFTAIKEYNKALDFALEVAKRSLFAEESLGIIQTKHNEIKIKMNDLEELV